MCDILYFYKELKMSFSNANIWFITSIIDKIKLSFLCHDSYLYTSDKETLFNFFF